VKIVRFFTGNTVQYGIIEGETVKGFRGSPFPEISGSAGTFEADGSSYAMKDVKLLSPCNPSKLVCLGLNYRSHAEEGKMEVPKSPIIFIKPSTSVIGPEENIVLPPGYRRVDYEAELGVVIGKTAKSVKEGDEFDYVLGYTCVNDVSERYNQRDDVQWTRSKSYDTFAPLGPCIVTGIDASNVLVESRLNGELRQSARTGELIFDIPYLIRFITGVMTLLPGDIISTGTMAGIGRMNDGDTIEITVENIGTLKNYVVSAK
jgi:2-keto-4-pentenoate hydratase/2-oxohepta-3-ene-1,7-dioic acid hydratase in catechol pathway